MNARASFTRMQDSTQPDWQIIGGEFMQFSQTLTDRVLTRISYSFARRILGMLGFVDN